MKYVWMWSNTCIIKITPISSRFFPKIRICLRCCMKRSRECFIMHIYKHLVSFYTFIFTTFTPHYFDIHALLRVWTYSSNTSKCTFFLWFLNTDKQVENTRCTAVFIRNHRMNTSEYFTCISNSSILSTSSRLKLAQTLAVTSILQFLNID